MYSAQFRHSMERSSTGEVPIFCATITHPVLVDPFRVNTDVVDYIIDDHRYYAASFMLELLTDSDRPPTARITIPNVDREINAKILAIRDAPNLRLDLYALSDFGAVTNVYDAQTKSDRRTRIPIATPSVEWSAPYLRLVNITGNIISISAEIQAYDLSGEKCPGIRSIPEFAPGLSR